MGDPLERFGANVRREREAQGLSQDALAQRIGMDPAEIRRIESARRDPGIRVVARLAAGLETTVSKLTRGID